MGNTKKLGQELVKAAITVAYIGGAILTVGAAITGTIVSGGAGAIAVPAALAIEAECLVAATATCVVGGAVAAGVGEVGENFIYSEGSPKGKSFRGGSKQQRDKWYGYNDKKFHKWFEREGKRFYNDNLDIENREIAREMYEIWKELGCPYPD